MPRHPPKDWSARRVRARHGDAKPNGEPGWSWRRAVIFPLVAFACWRLMMMENAPDTKVNETIAWGWVVMTICLALFYTGFATVQDVVAILATRSGLPYANAPADDGGEPPQDQPIRDERG